MPRGVCPRERREKSPVWGRTRHLWATDTTCHRTAVRVGRAKYQPEDAGLLPADTDGSTPTTSVHSEAGSTWFGPVRRPRRTRNPAGTGGNARVRDGGGSHCRPRTPEESRHSGGSEYFYEVTAGSISPGHAPFAVAVRHESTWRSMVDGTARVVPVETMGAFPRSHGLSGPDRARHRRGGSQGSVSPRAHRPEMGRTNPVPPLPEDTAHRRSAAT